MSDDSAIPQWKKDLIARLRSQNRRTGQQLFSAVQQPAPVSASERCECAKMVQEERSSDDEDLHYGPGIVSKLKERYLSLAQREKPKSVLRKAASLEHILDDAPEVRRYRTRENKTPNRYAKRGAGELKRARSVETISTEEREGKELKRESMHEEMLIKGSVIIPEKTENDFVRINRPKRIAPVMNEREKPPTDVVKQAKMIFERRPEQRTKPPQQTGEVAAKVASFKNIIVQNKPKKPTIKVKPIVDKPKTNGIRNKKTEKKAQEILRAKSPEKKFPRLDKPVSLDRSPDKKTRFDKPVSVDVSPLLSDKKFDKPVLTDIPPLPSPRSPDKKFFKTFDKPVSVDTTSTTPILSPRSPEKFKVFEKPVLVDTTSTTPILSPRSPEKFKVFEKPVLDDTTSTFSPILSPRSPEKKFLPSDLPSPKLSLSSELPTLKSSTPEGSPSLPSPIPDISRVDFIKVEENGVKSTSLTETPDLIVTSSPLPVVSSPSFRIAATENFIKEEIRLSLTERGPTKPPAAAPADDARPPPPPSTTPAAASTTTSMTFNFAKTNSIATTAAPKVQNRLPTVNKNVLNTQTPPSQPLKLEINGVGEKKPQNNEEKILVKQQQQQASGLTTLEIEKNLINASKTQNSAKKCEIEATNSVVKVPKVKRPPREPENNTIVFKFTDRKDVPDYVHNDGVKRVAKLEKPKVGEGGIIILPGASVDESFTDEDEEILRSLEGPPSPCDVTFINDNILIDGKSSLSQKTKRAKLRISFVDEGPAVFEYPSESSLLIEDSPKSPPVAQIRHSVSSLTGGTSLGSYTPKGTEDFQPGVTRSVQPISKPETSDTTDFILQEVEKPILFSAGANTDILF